MKDRKGSAWDKHIVPDGQPAWPSDEAERDKLASDLLGESLADNMDYWLGLALDVVRNPQASPERLRSRVNPEVEDERRAVLARLAPEERSVVERLLFETVHGVVFSNLVTLDQFPGAVVDLRVCDPESNAILGSIMQGSILDLHDRLGGWLDECSEFAGQWEPPPPKGGPTRE